MKLLGIAFFFLALLCVCTVGENAQNTTNSMTGFTLTQQSAMEAGNASTSQITTLQALTPTAIIRAVNESITSNLTTSSSTAAYQKTQGTTPQPPVAASTVAADKTDITTNTTQTSRTQSAHTKSLDASSTKESAFYSTTSLQNTTAHGSSVAGHHVNSTTESTVLVSTGSGSGNTKVSGSDIRYSSIILPIVITLIVITLSAFSLVALYRMCQKKTPERQENSTEQAQSDKEGVKLLSVKTTSPETDEVRCLLRSYWFTKYLSIFHPEDARYTFSLKYDGCTL